MQALGLIETRGLLAAVEGADAMLKAAEVTLIEKTYVGGGLVSIAVTGDVGAVKAAVEAGAAAIQQLSDTLLVSQHVIPRPHEELDNLILPIKPHKEIEIQQIKTVEVNPVDVTTDTISAVENMTISDGIDVTTDTVSDVEPLTIKDRYDEPESFTSKTDNDDMDTKAEAGLTEMTTVEEPKTIEEPETIEDTIMNEAFAADPIEILKPTLDDVNFNTLKKDTVDKIVKEYGIGKALEILNNLKVTKLRNLAREYKNLRIAGRVISKADKKLLIAEFKEYYRKN